MIPNDEFTYKVIKNSMKVLALDYGFTHAEPEAIDDLTSVVYQYLCKIVSDSKDLAEIVGRSSFNCKDVVITTTKTGIDIDALNEFMTCRDSVPAPDKLSEYPVQVQESSPTFSDDELAEREAKNIPNFLPSLRCKNKKTEKITKEKQKRNEPATRDPILKPITNVYKAVGSFEDIVGRISAYPRPKFDKNAVPKPDMIRKDRSIVSVQIEAAEREKQLEREKMEKEKKEREEAQRYPYQFLHTKNEEYRALDEARTIENPKIGNPKTENPKTENPKTEESSERSKKKHKHKKQKKEKDHEEKKHKDKDKSRKEKKKKHRESELESSTSTTALPEPLIPLDPIPVLPKEPQMPVLKPEKEHKKDKSGKSKEKKKEKHTILKSDQIISPFKIRPIPTVSEPIPPPPVLQPSVPLPAAPPKPEGVGHGGTEGSEEKKEKSKKKEDSEIKRSSESKKDKKKKKHKEKKHEGETPEEREERRRLKKEKKRKLENSETSEPSLKKSKIEIPTSPPKEFGLKLKILLPPKPIATSTPLPLPREPVFEKKPEPPPKSVTPISSDSSRPPSSRGSHSTKHTPEKYKEKLDGVKIMSERVQLSKALKESMETANPGSDRTVRSERRNSESKPMLKKKKKQKVGIQRPASGAFESIPGTSVSLDNPDDEEDEKYWVCPICKIRYKDGDDMVFCERCRYWYHWHCVGLQAEPAESDWFCRRCLDKMAKGKHRNY